jgi:hypothetical protein
MPNFKDALSRVFSKLVDKVANEPVFLTTLAIAGLNAYNEAQKQQLDPADALIFAATVVFGLLARELVFPAVKIDQATLAVKQPEASLEPPFTGEPE